MSHRWTLVVAAVVAGAGLAACTPGHSTAGPGTGSPSAVPSSPALPPAAGSSPGQVVPVTPGGPGATGVATPPPPGGSGITGITVATPRCPVVRDESSCVPKPLAAAFSVVSVPTGTTVVAVRSGPDGRFRVAVAPGTYLLRTGRAGAPVVDAAAQVTVADGRYTTVTVRCDTGLR